MVAENHQKRRKNNYEIEEKILKGIGKFNEIRMPEAKAELIEMKDKNFLVKFSGHMCATCGTYDYFDDLLGEFEDLSLKTKILGFRNFDDFYLVKYQILKVKKL